MNLKVPVLPMRAFGVLTLAMVVLICAVGAIAKCRAIPTPWPTLSKKNGSLHIRAVRQPDGSWSSARIKTLGKQRIQYGKVVARAKLPSGTGTWPAIWMLGERIAESGWPACGEIDIVEHVGKAQGSVHSSIHSISSFGMTRNTGDTIVADCSENFHDYSVEWSDTEITFAVDDQPFYTYRPTVRNNETWPFDAPFFLIANIAVGGNWGSEETLETQGKKDGIDPELTAATMEIDYIRVYELSSIAHSN